MIKNLSAAFLSIFISMNVLGILPIYISFVQNVQTKEIRKIVNTSILFTFLITISFIFIGKFIFYIIGIETFDFLIAGGLVLIVLAILMLLDIAYKQSFETKSFAIVPLATPLLAGPGLLTTSITVAEIYGYPIVCYALIFNLFIAYIILRYSSYILDFLGKEGIKAISKIASLLLASLGVMMIRTGLISLMKTL
ncbi:MAG TPA: MarC family protein [bacterium]|nr:MarC family protein [bacterium]